MVKSKKIIEFVKQYRIKKDKVDIFPKLQDKNIMVEIHQVLPNTYLWYQADDWCINSDGIVSIWTASKPKFVFSFNRNWFFRGVFGLKNK